MARKRDPWHGEGDVATQRAERGTMSRHWNSGKGKTGRCGFGKEARDLVATK